jgi:hypothetical protein
VSISQKVFNIARGAGVAAVLAFGGWALHAPVWLTVVAAAVVAGGTVFATDKLVHRLEMFAAFDLAERNAVTRWVGLASLVHVGWVAGVEIRPDLAAYWAAGLAVLTGGEYLAARALEFTMTRPVHKDLVLARQARVEARQATAAAQVQRSTPMTGMSAALAKISKPWVKVLDYDRVGSVGWMFTVQIPSQQQEGKATASRTLTQDDAEALAIALSELLGVPLKSSWIRIHKTPYAGRWQISVVTEDVMGRVIPYVDQVDAEGKALPASIRQPAVVSYRIDGTPVELDLRQHGAAVGRTRSGKSSGVNVKLAHVTRCTDAVVWACGVEKLYDGLAGWLEPYVGTGRNTPLDWVAYGQDDTLAMMAGLMRLARYRQSVPLGQRRRWTTVVLLLDEASFALENTGVKVIHDGRRCSASDLASMITKATGSADGWLWLSTQRGTNDQFGDKGGTAKANIGWVEVYQTRDPQEVGRWLGDEYYKLPKPGHKGQHWISLGEDVPVDAKAPYIQEVDPDRDVLHDGATIAEISWARRDLVVDEPLDENERRVLGRAYIDRRRTADELIAYLTGTRPQAANSDEQEGYRRAMAEMAALGLFDIPARASAGAAAPVPATAAAAIEPAALFEAAPAEAPRTWKQAIADLVAQVGQVSTAQILDTVQLEEGRDINRVSVQNTLSDMVAEGALAKPAKGLYVAGPNIARHVTSRHVVSQGA